MEAISKVPKQEHKKYDYYAFISYKHAKDDDTNKFVADEKWAHILKQQLELWHIPTQVPKEKRLNKNDKRIYPVFRDAENYPSGQLDELTCDRLSKSKTLVVVLSKEMLDDQIRLRYEEQNKTAYVFEEIEKFIKLGNTKDSIVIFYVGDDGINPNELLKEKIDLCKLNNWDCKALEYLYKPGEIIKKIRDFKDKGKEINQYVTAAVAAGIFNAAPEYFINAYELERKNRRNKIIILLLVLLIILMGLIASIFSQYKSKRTEEAFRYIELSKKAENAHDLQGARIIALRAYKAQPDLHETQQQILKVSNENPINPYASLPYPTLSSFEGKEIMHFQNDRFVIRRTSDFAIVDSIDIYSQEDVLLNSNSRKIAFVGFDSLKIYDRDTKQFVLASNSFYSRDLLSPMTDFYFPKMNNRFICLDWDGYVIDWDLLTKDSIMVPIKEILAHKSCNDDFEHVVLRVHGNSNDSCVIISYTIDNVCYIHEYNCVTRTINKLDSFNSVSYFYNSSNSSFLVFEENETYIKFIGGDKLIIDTSDFEVQWNFHNHQYDFYDVFNKEGDKFLLKKGDTISIYSSNGTKIKTIHMSSWLSGKFLYANWTTEGNLCMQYEKMFYILSEKDNYDIYRCIEYKRYDVPGNYYTDIYRINVLDSVIIETTRSYDARTHMFGNKALTRCYHKKQLEINESRKEKYFLPDGIHYIEEHYGFIEPILEYNRHGYMTHTRCVNSLNDSVVWKAPCGDIKMSPNKEKVCINDDNHFFILNSKTGILIYKNEKNGNFEFLSDNIIQYDVNDSISAVCNIENMQLLIEGRFKLCKVEDNHLACITNNSSNSVTILDVKTGQQLADFPIPSNDTYDIYFSPSSRYVIIPSRNYLNSADSYDSLKSNLTLIDIEKKYMMQNSDISMSCIFTKDEKHVLTLFFKHANVYDLKDFSLIKTFNFSGDINWNYPGVYVSKSNIFIDNETWEEGYELNTRNWKISDSKYRHVVDYDRYIWIDGFLYEKEPLIKRNKKNIVYVTESSERSNIEIISDSIIFDRDKNQVQKIRRIDETVKLMKQTVGERVLTQYEINSYK